MVVLKDMNSPRTIALRQGKSNLRAIRRQDFPDLPPELFQNQLVDFFNSAPSDLPG
jgi:hypothetical protein